MDQAWIIKGQRMGEPRPWYVASLPQRSARHGTISDYGYDHRAANAHRFEKEGTARWHLSRVAGLGCADVFEADDDAPQPKITPHFARPYPHAPGCPQCIEALICDVCGAPTEIGSRCSNGRCPVCHATACEDSNSIRHGFGSRREAQRQADKRRLQGV